MGIDWRPFWIALGFLTRLPAPRTPQAVPEEFGRSLLAYPLVGLVIGALLLLGGRLLEGSDPLLGAALLLSAWVAVTGALHLDGLADAADAWLGGHNDPQRSLEIMKDPRSGPAGVTALCLLLLIKFSALAALLRGGADGWLLVAPVVGRAALPALFLTTPYVRPGGLGSALAEHLPPARTIYWLLGLSALLLGGLLGLRALPLLVACLALFYLLRRLMLLRLGGTTGDTAGALVELLEAAALVTLALGR